MPTDDGLLWAEEVAERTGLASGKRVRELASASRRRKRSGAALRPGDMPLPVTRRMRSYPAGGRVMCPLWRAAEVDVFAANRLGPGGRPRVSA
jgi:hypothetical protein